MERSEIKKDKFATKKFPKYKKWIMMNWEIILYLSLMFLLYSLWSLITPTSGAPDEGMRLPLLLFMTENWHLPLGNEPTIRDYTWGFSYAYYPFISQIIGAFFFRITRLFTSSQIALLYAARLPSVLFSVFTLLFVYKTGLRLLNRRASWFLLILVSLWPSYALLASYINNDSFGLFTISIIIYAWAIGLERDWDWKSIITLSIGVGLCLISYFNAFGFVLLSGFLWIWCLLLNKKTRVNLPTFVKKSSVLLGIMFVLAGWWYIRNAIHYNGDFLGMRTLQSDFYEYGAEFLTERKTISQTDLTVFDMLFRMPHPWYGAWWIDYTYRSFIGMFGYWFVMVHGWVLRLYTLIILLGGVGIIAEIIYSCIKKKNIERFTFYLFCAFSIPIPIVLSVYNSYFNDLQPQGRYILPMLIALCIFIAKGIDFIVELFRPRINLRFVPILLILLVIIAHIKTFVDVFEFFQTN